VSIKDSAPTAPAVLITFSDTVRRFLDIVQIKYVGFYTGFEGPSTAPWSHDLWHVVANGATFLEDYKTSIGHRTGPVVDRDGIKMRQVLTRPNTLDAVAQLAMDATESDYEQCLKIRQTLLTYLSASDIYDLAQYGRTL
jgi:hypothetical protein